MTDFLALFSEFTNRYVALASFFFQVLVLYRFVDPRNRDFPLATLYSAVLPFLTAVVYFISTPFAKLSTEEKRQFGNAYAAADLVMHILLLALMLQLTNRSVRTLKLNPRTMYIIALVSISVLGASALFFLSQETTAFSVKFTNIRRIISVTLVILNLIWWTFLIRSRKIERRILLLSAGIGLQMTGQVISDSFFAMSLQQKSIGTSLYMIGVSISFLTHFLCLYSWYRAFSPVNATIATAPAGNPLNSAH